MEDTWLIIPPNIHLPILVTWSIPSTELTNDLPSILVKKGTERNAYRRQDQMGLLECWSKLNVQLTGTVQVFLCTTAVTKMPSVKFLHTMSPHLKQKQKLWDPWTLMSNAVKRDYKNMAWRGSLHKTAFRLSSTGYKVHLPVLKIFARPHPPPRQPLLPPRTEFKKIHHARPHPPRHPPPLPPPQQTNFKKILSYSKKMFLHHQMA